MLKIRRDTLNLEEVRTQVYEYFDEKIKPLIMDEVEDVVERCQEVADECPGSMKWVIKQYGDTVRASAHSKSYGYLFFMIATPEDKDEYDFGDGIIFHGSTIKE